MQEKKEVYDILEKYSNKATLIERAEEIVNNLTYIDNSLNDFVNLNEVQLDNFINNITNASLKVTNDKH
ncbi:9005_t:CDS:2 [Funneliformis caledonium]|uniref:9005_t:CDS:1 n=1 Tax=Funneliformis caledonium TaxID=1117310 RepID=A0A9N9E1L6_9GLOM|nr:9005_t:CDS:2 [Funneliformis caledonium]